MKILLTGMTRMQAHRPTRREYNTSINAFYHALLAAKHQVDWRPLEFDEKRLDANYDLVILGLGTISEFSCTYLYETLLATRYDNVMYLVNDWKANTTIKLLMEGDLFRHFVYRNNVKKIDTVKLLAMTDKIEKLRGLMFENRKLVGPFFEGWGNRAIITEGTPFQEVYEYDPSAFYLKHWDNIEIPKRKRKQWVYGALADYSRWHERIKGEWPILSFNKKTFIPEERLVREYYAKSVGMIMPRYKASGSGWWRARYCHAVLCQNVIYADEKEVSDIHPEFYRSIQQIERMPYAKLGELQRFQNYEIRSKMPSWNKVVDTVNGIVNEVRYHNNGEL